ncbi:type ISP restriction/modification enzyme [Chromohalobacter sp. 48-RD10]|uniref:DEAD/DEAH box helicase n=1 Tax=Chromohalobacter sp. 48-RD10 TaxID=2994063 RepID=UPI00246925B0|nr:type ISP restriction/modification enzyme [Chromohalobacter sp. 48-RD10]
MSADLHDLLDRYRQHARTPRELGTYFEELVQAWIEHDDVQRQQYDQVWSYADWVEHVGSEASAQDTGIDLVARIRGTEDHYSAIQCKFYSRSHRLQRGDIDSFISASGRSPFVERLIIDTTDVAPSYNVTALLSDADQYIPTRRIGLRDLQESRIDWSLFAQSGKVALRSRKTLRPDQQEALEEVEKGLAAADRGKLIMACGTGKTFTSLRIAEKLAGQGKRVLFMVPSLALMSQTVTEWSQDAEVELRSFAVCSDSHVGKRKSDDVADLQQHDLTFPATTRADALAREALSDAPEAMTVVFATYQSIQAVSDAQGHGLPEFDLIICDEAHRTTGVTLAKEDESNFVRIHNNAHVAGRKRLYMTATPRIFGEQARSKADEHGAALCDMDDESLFGKMLFHRGFAWAVENNLLTDYRVIVLAMDENLVSGGVQKLLSEDNELRLDDASRIVGCYKALMKEGAGLRDENPMRRALAFCRDIKSSQLMAAQFTPVIQEYHQHSFGDEPLPLNCEVRHVDGTYDARSRNQLLDWLKGDSESDECRILSNARCLSEGVDVPALDAIMFLHPRRSTIDVVQSVGRVMRRAPDKQMGYVILPIGVPNGVTPEEALNDNERYKVVWQILNALRAHDERMDATINRAGLGENVSDSLEIIGVNQELDAITQVSDSLPTRSSGTSERTDIGGHGGTDPQPDNDETGQIHEQFGINFNEEVSKAIIARIVKKCGTRDYWEDWAGDIADIARRHITRIETTLADDHGKARQAFDEFLNELRDDLNEAISETEAVEMLAQHLITRPVFDALFEGHEFTRSNPVSQGIQKVLDALDEHNLAKESDSLAKFYESVRRRAQGVQSSEGKQRLISELYDKFFRGAFPRLTERLGIVYTPPAVVDFMIHSVNDVLQQEFGQTLGNQGVHIIDPFTGTGTFITRLLQSGLIRSNELAHKYRHEIHANEIVLLAYYIAAINIEAVYHELNEGEYEPFEGICLTDTFQMYESDDQIAGLLEDNSERRKRQKALDIRVIMGNPPYSSGQDSANDNNANLGYPRLDGSIRESYAARSNATLKNSLYDSYIRAIRWGSDRLGKDGGVMAYVTNAGWLDGNAMDGLRQCLAEEFSSLYVFHLRGNARTQGEQRQKERGNVFGEGSRAPIAITLFVKNPQSSDRGKIHFHDIGDYLSREDKLNTIANLRSIRGIEDAYGWTMVESNEYGDWLNQRDDSFNDFILMGDKKNKDETQLFRNYSRGVMTGRDAWCYNASPAKVEDNMRGMIDFYNSEVDRYAVAGGKNAGLKVNDFIDTDPTQISWDRVQRHGVERGKKGEFHQAGIMPSVYRPFSKQWMYMDIFFNNCIYQMPKLFPTPETNNRVIFVTGIGGKDFSVLAISSALDIQAVFNGQAFPLKVFEASTSQGSDDLFSHGDDSPDGYTAQDGITDEGLAHFQSAYPGQAISKEDVFYYIYGLLHSPEYRERYQNNLSVQLPRIPRVSTYDAFRHFSDAGRKLADLHVDFEAVTPHELDIEVSGGRGLDELTSHELRVDKPWKFGKKGKEKDKTVVKYNDLITLKGVPLEAYDYVVNGKPALEWVMERQRVKEDKKSGIVNDANDYAVETMGDPAYPLKLFQRIVTVSLETMRIVQELPPLGTQE